MNGYIKLQMLMLSIATTNIYHHPPATPALFPNNMAYQSNVFVSDDPKLTSLYDYRTAKDYAAYLLPHLKPNFSILDVGCGPGSITRDFAQFVPEGRVVGIDVSSGVVDQARAKFQAPNLSFEVGDATDLAQFADNTLQVDPERAARSNLRL